jgi:hypothetical protein
MGCFKGADASFCTPQGRADATATRLGNGRVLLAGGDNPSGLSSAELYNPSTRSWSGIGSMTQVHALATAVLLKDGRVLVAGGVNGQTGDVYSPATGSWFLTIELPVGTLWAVGDVFGLCGDSSWLPSLRR